MDSKGMKELRENIKGIPGELDKMNKAAKAYDEVNKSGKAWSEFKESLSVTGIELGEVTLPIITTGLKQMSSTLQEFRGNMRDIVAGSTNFQQVADTLISVYTLGGSNLINKGASKIGEGASSVYDKFVQFDRKINPAEGVKYINKGGKLLTQEEATKTQGASNEVIKVIFTTDDQGNLNINPQSGKPNSKVKIMPQGITNVGG
jgi:hypothetical protein